MGQAILRDFWAWLSGGYAPPWLYWMLAVWAVLFVVVVVLATQWLLGRHTYSTPGQPAGSEDGRPQHRRRGGATVVEEEADELKEDSQGPHPPVDTPPPEPPVTPPAALWKYLPVPDEPDRHEESASCSGRSPEGMSIVGAQVRGVKHKHEGLNCDDWFEFKSVGPWTMIAVSDGAGSARFSRVGAEQACKAAVGRLCATWNSTRSSRARPWPLNLRSVTRRPEPSPREIWKRSRRVCTPR